jgi:hypothetical protein
MDGFERFDVRAWGKNGLTKHVTEAVRAVDSARRDVRRIVVKFVAQATIAVVASAGGSAVLAMTSANAQILSSDTAFSIEKSPAANAILDATSTPNSSYDLSAIRGASELSAAQQTEQPIGAARVSALDRFMKRHPAQMSDRTRELAEIALGRRAAASQETGEVWAERVMNNIYLSS